MSLWLWLIAGLAVAATACDESLPAFARPPPVDAGMPDASPGGDAAAADVDAGAE